MTQVYNRPLQKNVPTVPNSKVMPRENPPRPQKQQAAPTVAAVTLQAPPPAAAQRLSKSQPRENCDPKERAEVLGLVRSDQRSHSMQNHRNRPHQQHRHHPHQPHPSPNNSDSSSSNKNHDMDYQEDMNIINKVRKTKEFTRVRTEQIRLASMYAQEKKRQEEMKLEEQRLRTEREKIEKEREEAKRSPAVAARGGPAADSNRSSSFQEYEKGQLDNDESEQAKVSPQRSPMRNAAAPAATTEARADQSCSQDAAAEKARMEQIRLEQQEQKRQQELRELQVKAEQEKLERLREEQLRQEKGRAFRRRLEHSYILVSSYVLRNGESTCN